MVTTNRTPRSGRGAAGGRSASSSTRASGTRGTAAQRRARKQREARGLALIALGLILGLAMYTGATGSIGSWLANAIGAVVGRMRLLVPLFALWGGWHLLRTAPGKKKKASSKKKPIRPLSETVGWVMLFLSLFAILDLIGGRPGWGSSAERLSNAGGWLGVWVGGSFESWFGFWGEIVLTTAMVMIALVLLTGLSTGSAVDVIGGAFDRVRDGIDAVLLRLGLSTAHDDKPKKAKKQATTDASGLLDLEFPDDLTMVTAPDDGELFDQETYIDLRADGSPEPSPDQPYDAPDVATPLAESEPSSWDLPAPQPIIEIPEVAVVDGMTLAAPQPAGGNWTLPTMEFLERSEGQDVDRAGVERTGRQLEHALAEHGVETRLIGVVVGPTVSRFELELGPGVKVNRVTSLHKDIAYAMATPDVRILAPIPGKQAIGVEVPNVRRQIITVGDLLGSEEAIAATHPLDVALGRDITGKTVMANLAKMPHLLVAGQTGSGKSSCINSMLTSLLMRTTPEQVRLILVDPKRVELTQYERLPHLLTEVVTDPKKAANALAWGVREMERRYDALSEVSVRDIDGYNKAVDEGRLAPVMDPSGDMVERERLSYIVIILDELADLMMVAARDVEESICRIAQKARAVGIHLVIATQRPSTNVITGLIKANVPARLAFAVSSLTDSRVVLDQAGAERLVGRGDGLLLDGSTSTAARFQGAWITEEEVSNLVDHWQKQAPEVVFDSRVQGEEVSQAAAALPGGTTGDDDDDELVLQAIELVVRSQLGSTSMLQRKLRVGFARAGRLMDIMEERGVVGPTVGSKARDVLMTPEDLDTGRWPAAMRTGTAPSPAAAPVVASASRPASAPTPAPAPPPPTIAAVPDVATSSDFDEPFSSVAVKDPSGEMDLGPSSDRDALVDRPFTGFGFDDDDEFADDGFDAALAPPPGYRQPD